MTGITEFPQTLPPNTVVGRLANTPGIATAATMPQLASALLEVGGISSSSFVSFLQSGIGAVATDLQTRGRLIVIVTDFGADPTGVADSSTAFQNAVNSGATYVFVPPPASGKKYIVHDVTIPSGVTLHAEGAYFVDAVGADHIFNLSGYSSKLIGGYISSGTNCATANVIIDQGNKCELRGTRIVNGTLCIKMTDSSNGANGYGATKNQLIDVICDSFTVGGLYSGANVHDTQIVNTNFDANTISGGGAQIPRTGVYGVTFDATGSTLAFGGHLLSNVTCINMQDGFVFNNTNLIKLTNCISDSLSGRGYALTGNTSAMDLDSCFAGTCAIGVSAEGSGSGNKVRGLRTYGVGVIPAWGGTTFYSSAGYSSFYDIRQLNTAIISVDAGSWEASGVNAHSYSEAVQGNIEFTGAWIIPFNSKGTVAANSTVYLGPNGQSATEIQASVFTPQVMYWIATAARIYCASDGTPGGSDTFSWTLRLNFADTAITGTTGSAATVATMSGGPVSIGPIHDIDLKLVTSATASARNHRGYIVLLPQPS